MLSLRLPEKIKGDYNSVALYGHGEFSIVDSTPDRRVLHAARACLELLESRALAQSQFFAQWDLEHILADDEARELRLNAWRKQALGEAVARQALTLVEAGPPYPAAEPHEDPAVLGVLLAALTVSLRTYESDAQVTTAFEGFNPPDVQTRGDLLGLVADFRPAYIYWSNLNRHAVDPTSF